MSNLYGFLELPAPERCSRKSLVTCPLCFSQRENLVTCPLCFSPWSPVLSVSARGRVWSPSVLSVSDAGEGTSLSLHARATGRGASGTGTGPTWSGRAAPDAGTGRDGQDGLWSPRPGRRVPPHDGRGATAPLIRARVRGKPEFGSLISRLW